MSIVYVYDAWGNRREQLRRIPPTTAVVTRRAGTELRGVSWTDLGESHPLPARGGQRVEDRSGCDTLDDVDDALCDAGTFAAYPCGDPSLVLTAWRLGNAAGGRWHQEDAVGFPAGDANVRRYAGNQADEHV